MFHVERATPEDLPSIWELDEATAGHAERRSYLFQAVQNQSCLVAKAGWTILGFAVREPGFFGYPLIARIVVHPDHRRQGIARALFAYAEKTTTSDRLFTSAQASNIAAQAIFTALGYERCGEISHINANGAKELFFYKMLSSSS